MTATKTAKPAKKAAPRKATPRKPTAPQAVDEPGRPPLEAIDTPAPKRPVTRAKRQTQARRRGATAPPSPAELVELRERERTAVELAAAGVTDWDLIASEAGYADRSAAWKAVQRVLDRQEFSAAADYRRLIGYRLERIIRANWAAATTVSETPAKDKATNRVFRATEQLRRTFGLDVEIDKLADALRIPADPVAREEDLRDIVGQIRQLRVVGGTETGE